MPPLETVRYELVDEGRVARITLDRARVRNAQNRRMLAEIDDCFNKAELDDEVKVVVMSGEGPHFSAGHDLKDYERWLADPDDVNGGFDHGQRPLSGGFARPGAEGYLAFEEQVYFRLCRRWHDFPKPTIAAVHGKVIAGGLMLMWVCDLIVASEETEFLDITVQMGVNGVEWFSHPWELGPRRAKEMLFTGDPVTAADAFRLGMVNKVVPHHLLDATALELARRIATKPSLALRLAKMSVNQTLDAQGFWTAQQAAFNLHHIGHSDMRERGLQAGIPVNVPGKPDDQERLGS